MFTTIRRRGERPWGHVGSVAVTSLLLVVAGCGDTESTPSTSIAPVTSTATTTAGTMTPTTVTHTTPATTVPPITAAPVTVAHDEGPEVAVGQTLNRVWFLTASERLAPAYRDGTTAAASVRALLDGPVAGDIEGLVTLIPAGTELRSITMAGGVATVDLTGTFASGGGSLSMMGRIAQVVYTLTEFPGVERVAFALDGQPVEMIGGEGIIVSPSVGREDVTGFQPFVMVTSPLPGQTVSSPFLVSGQNSTHENTVEISLEADDGTPLVSTYTTGTGPIMDDLGNPVWGPYQASIAFDPGSATEGTLTVYESSMEDAGRRIVEFPLPVRFSGTATPGLPGASTAPVSTPEGVNGPGLTALLRDVRTGRHEGYERVVFEFVNDRVPGYSVQYVERPVIADPSGDEVSVTGDAILSVRLSWASGYDLTGDLGQVYIGSQRLSVGYPAVQEVVETGDFEAVLNWVIGVRTRPAFKVTTLTNPARVVIDIASAGTSPSA